MMKTAVLILLAVCLAGCDEASSRKADASIGTLFPDKLTTPLAHVVSGERTVNIAKTLAEKDVCASKATQHMQSNWLIVSNDVANR
jgi:hypothetical protein